jgi:hypothetical protein
MLDAILGGDFHWLTEPNTEPEAQSNQTVTLNVKVSDGVFVKYGMPFVKSRPLTAIEVSHVGATLAKSTKMVEVWAEILAAATPSPCPKPKIADYWTLADGTTWNIVRMGGVATGLNDQRINTYVQKRV